MVGAASRSGLVARRSAAYLTDIAILFGGILATQFALKAATGFPSEHVLNTGARIESWVLLSVSLPSWMYFALFESSSWQGTPGKRLLRLMVVGRKESRIGVGRAVLRTLIKVTPWEVTHASLFLPTPLLEADTDEVRSGLILANALLVLYVVALLVTGGTRTVHDFVARTEIRRRGSDP